MNCASLRVDRREGACRYFSGPGALGESNEEPTSEAYPQIRSNALAQCATDARVRCDWNKETALTTAWKCINGHGGP